MNDVFIEQIVLKKQDLKSTLKKMGIILAALLIPSAFLLIAILRFVFPVVLAISCWLAWILLKNQNIEFEYSYTNGELDVDKILGKRRREHVASVSVRRFDILAPFTTEFAKEFESKTIRTIHDVSPDAKSEKRWFARYTDDGGVETLLIFEPNDRMLAAMGRLIPRKFKGTLPELPQ